MIAEALQEFGYGDLALQEFFQVCQELRIIPCQDQIQKREIDLIIQDPQYVTHQFNGDILVSQRGNLVEETQGIPEGASALAGQ